MQWFLDVCVQPGGYWLPVLILGAMLCLTLVAMVAVAERGKLRRAKLKADLTKAMLQRGMSPVEILHTVAASRVATHACESQDECFIDCADHLGLRLVGRGQS